MAVCVSPADVAAAKTLMDSAIAELGGGQAAKTEEGGGESKGEVEEKPTLVPEGENDPPMWSQSVVCRIWKFYMEGGGGGGKVKV